MKISFTSKSDLDEILDIESNRDNSKYIVANTRADHLKLINDADCNHLIIRSLSGRFLGFVILAGIKSKNKSIEFRRIVIADKGKGYGRKVIQEIKSFCFNKLECNRLWLDVVESNLRARKLYESEGFKVEGKLRESLLINGEYANLIIMSMLKKEYNKL